MGLEIGDIFPGRRQGPGKAAKQVGTMGFSGISRLGLTTVILLAALPLAGCSGGESAQGNVADDIGSRNAVILEISDLQRQLAAMNVRAATAEQALQRARAEADWLAKAAQAEPQLRARIAELEAETALLMADMQHMAVLEANLRDLEAENKRLSRGRSNGRGSSPAGQMPGIESGELEARPDSASYGDGTYAVHLASYRSKEAAEEGWQLLRGRYPDLLGQLSGHFSMFDVASLGGRYYRLKAGPFEGADGARELCRKLNDAGEYCVVAVFDGQDQAQ